MPLIPSNPDPDHIQQVLERICQIPAPVGREAAVRSHLEETWGAHGVETRADPIGNLLGRVGGSGPRVLLQAHMDEIGFVVRHISDDGFLFLDSAQAAFRDKPERRFEVGQSAIVLGRSGVVSHGVIVAPSGHVVTPSELEKPLLSSDYFLDVGAESRAEVEAAGVHIASPVVWQSPTRLLGNRVVSRALDDRVGLAAIELALEWLEVDALSCELWVAATAQEENILHGARALAAHERFDAVLALDVTLAGDTPAINATAIDSKLGAGPLIVHSDAVAAYSHELAWEVADAGEKAGIPVQHGAFRSYGTDGIAFIDSGSPAVALGPPTRYTHTPYELADVRDIHHTAALLVAYVTGPR